MFKVGLHCYIIIEYTTAGYILTCVHGVCWYVGCREIIILPQYRHMYSHVTGSVARYDDGCEVE